ncbi:hypothetical protein QR97_01925 [Streptomyces sp. PBH53]|uniref:hypothetical protein n=1 Tax=Streptomyces sp. PBH53 TaxID=1577075 RepID=UPI000655DB7C|nr:hypothetical protein [Streptomyces sp. PBH53]AKN68726.1 hypothetical protein QR97_01925 [Streptomyces sp. PBH53]
MSDTLLHYLVRAVELLGVVGFATTLLAWKLANVSRARQARQDEQAALEKQADTVIVAVADLRAVASMNRTLWERPLERLTAVGLAAVTFHAGRAGARIMGGTEWLSQAVGMGAAAQLIAREVHANKAAVAAVREPLKHVTEALAPLVRHPDQRVATTAEELLAATSAILDHAQVEAAIAAFGEAVRAAVQPVPSRWSRLRRRAPQST